MEKERQVLNFNGKHFYFDTVSEEAKEIVSKLRAIDYDLKAQSLTYETMVLGKGVLEQKLDGLSKDFEEAPEKNKK